MEANIAEKSNEDFRVNGLERIDEISELESADSGLEKGDCAEDCQNSFAFKCDDSELLTLYSAFRQIHRKKLSLIDCSSDEPEIKCEKKLQLLQTYVEQLEEQFEVLVSTLVELQKEAEQRVLQMEKRLKSSAKSTMDTVLNLHKYEQDIRKMVMERLHLESVINDMQQNFFMLQEESNFLRDQNFNLKHDIQALLHIIQHARTTGDWEMDCVTFCEVTPEQVFGPVQSMSQVYSPESMCMYASKINEEDKPHVISQYSSESSISSSSNTSINMQPGASEICDEVRHSQFLKCDMHSELLKKDKIISVLQSQLSEVKHHLALKESECQCHLWEIETLQQQKKCLPCDKEIEVATPEDTLLDIQNLCNSPLQKSISLPIIENQRYINKQKLISSKSYPFRSKKKNVFLRKQEYLYYIKQRINKSNSKKEKQPCRPVVRRSDYVLYPRAYSEPHLFLYGDSIYVYRPCEPLHRDPNFALTEDYHNDLHLCQSIDLKLPTDEHLWENGRPCEWNCRCDSHDHPVSENIMPYDRIQVSVSSSTCSHSEELPDERSSTCLCNDVYCPANKLNSLSHSERWHSGEDVFQVEEIDTNYIEKKPALVNVAVQTVTAKSTSIALQTNILEEPFNTPQKLPENGFTGMDVKEINKTMQSLKENLLRAEDKALAKEMLIEQLQSHIITSVKEVELKDKALENVEKKLDVSRQECAALKNQVSELENRIASLLKEQDDTKALYGNLQLNVEVRQEQIDELKGQLEVLQDQKRTLMTQLDSQGDELEEVKQNLQLSENKLNKSIVQLEQQSQIIKSLQDALVQTKRAMDEAQVNHRTSHVLNSSVFPNKSTNASRNSIVDI